MAKIWFCLGEAKAECPLAECRYLLEVTTT